MEKVAKRKICVAAPSNPFPHINLFPGFEAKPETLKYVEERSGPLRLPLKNQKS